MSEIDEQIRLGLEENDQSPWEWGVYIERSDREGDWTPLVHPMPSEQGALMAWSNHHDLATNSPLRYRNPRLVRRAVSPWEVQER